MAYFTASDGAEIYYTDEGAGVPILSLSGLTRTGRDFDYLAPYLPPCRLIRMDYRGRGESAWTGAASYTVPREGLDALELLAHLDVAKTAILGTSRGGLIGLYLAAVAKDRLLGLCLNDVGPELARGGLNRIFDYLGRNPSAKTHEALAAALPRLMLGFHNVSEARWLAEARLHYAETPEGLRITYDPSLREAFINAMNGPEVNLWPLFDACEGLPLALLRAQNSDLVTPETAERMQSLRPDMLYADVKDRAHIPFLDEPEAVGLVRDWVGMLVSGGS